MKKTNEAWTYPERFLNITAEYHPNAERSSQVRTAIGLDMDCYMLFHHEKEKTDVQISLNKYLRKVDKTPPTTASKSAAQSLAKSSASPSFQHYNQFIQSTKYYFRYADTRWIETEKH